MNEFLEIKSLNSHVHFVFSTLNFSLRFIKDKILDIAKCLFASNRSISVGGGQTSDLHVQQLLNYSFDCRFNAKLYTLFYLRPAHNTNEN